MTDNEIVRCLEKWLKEMHLAYQTYLEYGGKQDARNEEHIDLIGAAIDIIKHQQEMIDALIAGQETLQKHFTDKLDRIVEELEERADDCKRYWENFGDEDEVSIMLGYKRAIGVVKGAINDR